MRKIKETIVSVWNTETKTERIIEDFDPTDETTWSIKLLACIFWILLALCSLSVFWIIFKKADWIFNWLKDFSQAVFPIAMLLVYWDRQRKIMQGWDTSNRTLWSFIISLILLVVIHFSI